MDTKSIDSYLDVAPVIATTQQREEKEYKISKKKTILSLLFPDTKISPRSASVKTAEEVSPKSPDLRNSMMMDDNNVSNNKGNDVFTDDTPKTFRKSLISVLITCRNLLNPRRNKIEILTQELQELKQSKNEGMANFTLMKRRLTVKIEDSLLDQQSMKERLKYKDAEADRSKEVVEQQSLRIRSLKLKLQDLKANIDQLRKNDTKTIHNLMEENKILHQEKYEYQRCRKLSGSKKLFPLFLFYNC